MHQKIIILDFGSQYTQLIARKIRELNVYCEIHPYYHEPNLDADVKGIILSGSPASVRTEDCPKGGLNYIGKIPVLGVCYGAQLMAQELGGEVAPSKIREYGRALITEIKDNPLLKGIEKNSQVWMSHADTILHLPPNTTCIASTDTVANAAFQFNNQQTWGIQFHPEVAHTLQGVQLLKNFLVDICGCTQDWTPAHYVNDAVTEIKAKVGDDKVVMGLSGGVDSSVAALLIHQAIHKNLYCIFVDNGLLRKNEWDEVFDSYKNLGLNIVGVDAKQLFYDALKDLTDPEQKRKAIGRVFIEVFDAEAKKIENVKWLGQGTIYPDVIESVSVKGPSATIKSHHNVGGLPEKMALKVLEPINTLFKDEVRRVGRQINLPENILGRHPFPGPGLAIRILGDITPEKVALLQEVDSIFINCLKEANLYNEVWQAGAILLPVKSVGVMGDERTYENAVCLRAVQSTDGMTADWVHLPYEFLANISNQIINRVKGINRVVYDISSKPPATIEWE
ncbi:MAG: glutamine-hydrolyzing GMP synthase [Bacteroidetes bacterium]|nr:glutamine-hydrolyzing GMP synthase [Bacteroidota bacterium]